MRHLTMMFLVTTSMLATGCAHLEFPEDDKGLPYFEPLPYMLITTTPECVTTGTVVMIPGERKIVELKSGYGSSELSVTLTNGMISAVGQKTDTKVPETVTAMAALATATALAKEEKPKCKPSAILYPIRNGTVDVSGGTVFPISQ